MTLCTYVIIYVRRKINFYISPPCTTPTWDCVFFKDQRERDLALRSFTNKEKRVQISDVVTLGSRGETFRHIFMENIWGFPEMEVPLNHLFLIGIFHYKPT